MNYLSMIVRKLPVILLIIGAAIGTGTIVLAQQTTEEIDIEFNDETYGLVTQSIGIIVPASLSPETVMSLKETFPQGGVYLKIMNPTVSTVNGSAFQSLYESDFNWYFLFTDPNNSFPVIDAYKTNFTLERLVIEVEKDDTGVITDLRGTYPNLKIHAGHLAVWPRSQVNEILSEFQPPTIEGISFWLGLIDEGEGVFRDVEFAFDTMFDASKSIAGEEVNFPPNTILSISDNQFPSYTDVTGVWKTAYLSGIMSGSIITTVQSQGRGGEAPIRYMIPGNFSDFAASERLLLAHFSRFTSLHPEIVWPYAIPNNGDIWDNNIFDQSNTKPIVGVIGKIQQGYYGFVTNTSHEPYVVDFGNNIDFSTHSRDTTQRPNSQITNGKITLSPHETIIFYPISLGDIDTSGPTPTHSPTPDPEDPTPTPISDCAQQQRMGNYNCSGGVDEVDYTDWVEDYEQGVSTLTFFEYWRRTFY
ncbi:hypothetical protein HY469_03980 [Candidatus Roizmanbacteria bacterium]|nr:hypothetical protein [Candidatus Roizmanbacteria bacterium]